MSQSPESADPGNEQDNYLRAFGDLAQRIRDGASFSGRERHCAFLNNRDGSFSDISTISGFGLPEDGRGMALTDWDHDGDLDVWISNRNAPRIQFFRNGLPDGDTAWVSLRLEGDPARQCPRDAVGSQVEVVVSGSSGRLVKTLHAGAGLMSQSSKWLHFGLGDSSTIEKVIVRWSGGAAEEFGSVTAGQRWLLTQGTGTARAAASRTPVNLAAAPLELPEPTDLARIRLSQPLKIPALEYHDVDGRIRDIGELSTSQAVLVNLWATWCTPCVAELKAFAAARDELVREGIEVVALNVDHLDPDSEVTPEEAANVLAKYGFTMTAGMAPPELVDLLATSIRKSVYRHRDMPVPISFLIDRGGWLSAIYKGPVEVAQVVEDRRALGRSKETARAAAVPFTGTWSDERFTTNPIAVAATYAEGGYYADARHALQTFLDKNEIPPGAATNAAQQQRQQQLAGVLAQLGQVHLQEGNQAAARTAYERSLAYNPKQVPVLNSLAWLLATSGDPAIRDGKAALRHANFLLQAPGIASNPVILSTLAAAQAASGQFDQAADNTRRIIALLGERGSAEEIAEQRERLRLYQAGQALTLD